MPTEREIVMDAADMVKDIPASDVLVPLQQEDKELTPFPEAEYKVIEAPTMDKLVRDVNNHLKNGRQTEWGVQVSSGNLTRFYQSMIRWNVDADIDTKPEMPSENFNAGTQGPKPLYIPGLEDEPDLYEDVGNNAEQ